MLIDYGISSKGNNTAHYYGREAPVRAIVIFNGERKMPQIGKTERTHVEFYDILPYWKKFIKEMHARGILYSEATEKEKLMVLNKVRKDKR